MISLWFFAAARYQGNHRLVGGMFRNRNAGDVNAWTYVPDESHQAEADSSWKNVSARLTWQASPRNKFNFYWDEQRNCTLVQRRRHGDHRARGARQQPVAAAGAAGDLDVAGDEPPAVRSRGSAPT